MIVACLKLGRLYCRFLSLPASRTMSVHIGCRTELSDFCSLFFRPIWMWLSNWLTMWIFIIIQYYWNKLYYPFISDTSLFGIDLFINLNHVGELAEALEDSARKLNDLGLKAPKDVQPNIWDLSESFSGKFREIELSLNNLFLFLAGYRWEQLVPGMFIAQGSNCCMNITGLHQDNSWVVRKLTELSGLFILLTGWLMLLNGIGTDLIMCSAGC